jgi:hypothetical protein
MIDFIINETGGITVAHTLKTLDGYDALDIDLGSGDATLSGPDGSRRIGSLDPTMLVALKPDMCGQIIRTSGWSIAKVTQIAVTSHH